MPHISHQRSPIMFIKLSELISTHNFVLLSKIESFIFTRLTADHVKQEIYKKISIVVILIAAVLRFAFALIHTVSGDACWHLASARFIAVNNKVPLFEGLGRLQPFWPPPLFHFAAASFYKIFGIISLNFADLSLKLISPVFGTLTVIIAYLTARKLFSEKIAFYSMIFLNFVPVFLDYSIFAYTDSTAAFFSVLSVYLMLNEKYIFSSVSLGLAMLSKYNAIFVLPMLLFLAYKSSNNKKERSIRMSIAIVLPLLISSVWFLRNFILLGNPFWPYLNGIFHGVDAGVSFNSLNFKSLLSFSSYWRAYLELFGVPNGEISVLSFYNLAFVKYLFFVWIAGTLIFIYPFIIGLFSPKSKDNQHFLKATCILFLSHMFMLLVYLVNTRWFGSRLLLPVIPFMSIIWAKCVNSIKMKNAYLLIALVISIGFVGVEAVKISVAAKEWAIYKQDFEWAKSNSNENEIFYGNGQCLSYNINRLVVDHTAPPDFNKIDYAWVNSKWRIDFQMNEGSLNKIKNNDKLKIAYSNANTGTTIYKVK